MSGDQSYRPTPLQLDIWVLCRASRTRHEDEWECIGGFLKSRYPYVETPLDYQSVLLDLRDYSSDDDMSDHAPHINYFEDIEKEFRYWKQDRYEALQLRGLALQDCDRICQLRICAQKSWSDIALFISLTQHFNCTPADAALAFGYGDKENIGRWERWLEDYMICRATLNEWWDTFENGGSQDLGQESSKR